MIINKAMKTNQINFNDNRLELSVKRPSHFITIFMLTAASFCLLVPLIFFIYLLMQSVEGFPIRLLTIVFLLIPFVFGIYLLRLFLWNFYGKEVYVFEKNKFIYLTDYKYFKDAKKEVKFKSNGFRSESSGYEKEKKAVLTIETNGQKHKSAVELPENELNKLIELLNQKLNPNE
jgi:hypothetical protein